MVIYDKIDEELGPLQKWVDNNKNLPKIEKILLKHYINVCDGNMQEAKKLIELNYSIRANYPHLFIERDPLDKGIQTILNSADNIYLPKLTPENYVIQISRIVDPDPDKYLFKELIQTCGMLYDLFFHKLPEKTIIDGGITIFDIKYFTLKHLTKINLSALRAFTKFFEKTIPIQIRQVHVINSPPFINKILAVLKPFISDHVSKMMIFHEPNSTTLFDYVSKDLLPCEFGGTQESIDILRSKQAQDLKDCRNYLMDPSYWKSKSSEDANTNELKGNFKNLSFD